MHAGWWKLLLRLLFAFMSYFILFYQDSGPQLPTNVTPMLKYGTNLLQAVGLFNGMFEQVFYVLKILVLLLEIHPLVKRIFNHCIGHYILAIAFMGVISSPANPVLQQYVQPAIATLHSGKPMNRGKDN